MVVLRGWQVCFVPNSQKFHRYCALSDFFCSHYLTTRIDSMLFRARNSELKLSMEFSQEVDSLRASLTSAREEVADYRDRIIFARRAESELQRQHAEATEAATKAKELHSSDALESLRLFLVQSSGLR